MRVAAAGDIHVDRHNRDELARAFAALNGHADVVLIAGDLTTHGEPEQAQVLADTCRALTVPVVAVLGNHDLHSGHGDEVAAILKSAGVQLLDRSATILELEEGEVGIVGTKGFVGGFTGSQLPDFGEQLLRRVYAETSEEVEAIRHGLQEIAHCPIRIVLLHYSPTASTLGGEPRGIWPFLGTDRLAGPILEHRPDVVLHGHTHAGTFEGAVGPVPVFNVAVPVLGRDFFVFELDGVSVRAAA